MSKYSGILGRSYLWLLLTLLILNQIAWTAVQIAAASFSQQQDNNITLNVALNQLTQSEWFWRNNLTALVLIVTWLCECYPNVLSLSIMSLYTNVSVFFSWLGMSVLFHYGVLSTKGTYHAQFCDGSDTKLCATALASGWLDSFNIIWIAGICVWSIYQVIRSISLHRNSATTATGSTVLRGWNAINLLSVSLMVAGYIVWCIGAIGIQANGTNKGNSFSIANTSWPAVYVTDWSFHFAVIISICLGSYAIDAISNMWYFIVTVVSWVTSTNLLPMFVYLAVSQYSHFNGICSSLTGPGYECGSRQAVVWGMFITMMGSWLLSTSTTVQWLTTKNITYNQYNNNNTIIKHETTNQSNDNIVAV